MHMSIQILSATQPCSTNETNCSQNIHRSLGNRSGTAFGTFGSSLYLYHKAMSTGLWTILLKTHISDLTSSFI